VNLGSLLREEGAVAWKLRRELGAGKGTHLVAETERVANGGVML
jgi:hypothetical protein